MTARCAVSRRKLVAIGLAVSFVGVVMAATDSGWWWGVVLGFGNGLLVVAGLRDSRSDDAGLASPPAQTLNRSDPA